VSCSVCKGSHNKLWLVLTDGARFYVKCDKLAKTHSEAWLCVHHLLRVLTP
jgi:hypothetical protein